MRVGEKPVQRRRRMKEMFAHVAKTVVAQVETTGLSLDEMEMAWWGVCYCDLNPMSEGDCTMCRKSEAKPVYDERDVREFNAYDALCPGSGMTIAQFVVMRDEWEAAEAANPCSVWNEDLHDGCTCGDRGVCPTCDPGEWDVSKW
jgi:hypothetical protein